MTIPLLAILDAEHAYRYARYVFEGPWAPGEAAINSESHFKHEYKKFLDSL